MTLYKHNKPRTHTLIPSPNHVIKLLRQKLSKFNKGNFDVIIDYGQTEHMISENILGKITEYIQNNS